MAEYEPLDGGLGYDEATADCGCVAEDAVADSGVAGLPRALVFDMRNPVPGAQDTEGALGQWYVWRLPGTEAPAAACMHDGKLHWLAEDGIVRYETADQAYDDTNTPIYPEWHFAPMSFTDLSHAIRVYETHVNGKYYGASTLRVTATLVDEDSEDPAVWTEDVVLTAALQRFAFNMEYERGTSLQLTVAEVASGQLSKGWGLRTISFEIGSHGRLNRLGDTQKIGD